MNLDNNGLFDAITKPFMNITHSEMVARLIKPKADLQFTPEQADMIHAILGISGECGELLDAVKKHVIYGKPLDIYNMIEELGDAEFYLEHLRTIIGVSREQCLEANMSKLAKRYPNYEYTDVRAKERADKSDDGWIEWHGGVCPVAEETRVNIRLGNGNEYEGIACHWGWGANQTVPVVAYRIA